MMQPWRAERKNANQWTGTWKQNDKQNLIQCTQKLICKHYDFNWKWTSVKDEHNVLFKNSYTNSKLLSSDLRRQFLECLRQIYEAVKLLAEEAEIRLDCIIIMCDERRRCDGNTKSRAKLSLLGMHFVVFWNLIRRIKCSRISKYISFSLSTSWAVL